MKEQHVNNLALLKFLAFFNARCLELLKLADGDKRTNFALFRTSSYNSNCEQEFVEEPIRICI